jgi:elongation factor 1-gamma
VREHVSTYLITHPHLDHVSGFVINTAAFHNTSRPKRLAALPFTVNAIKTHIFNNILWPNLTDEDGGVGLVTFQRLAEGGNIALGEGSGRGYIEVCDGLGVRGFKVSHGHCMKGPGHVHRGSNANLPETPGIGLSRASTHHHDLPADGREVRSLSFSLATQSGPGTPLFTGGAQDANRTSNATGGNAFDQCIVDSTAYFIRTEYTPHTPTKEVLIFGDVEPDSLSLSPRTAYVWAEAAPKIAAGILTGIFIECSYTNAQGDAVLYGHLGPRHLLQELQNLAEMVKEARKEHEKEKEEARKGRKRKRASNGLLMGSTSGGIAVHESARKTSKTRGSKDLKTLDASADDEIMTDYAASPTPAPGGRGATGTHTPSKETSYSSAPAALNVSSVSAEHSRALMSAVLDSPLKGLKVVIIHVKDTLADGPLVGELILNELEEGERALAEQGKGLGCVFEVSRSGGSYWF